MRLIGFAVSLLLRPPCLRVHSNLRTAASRKGSAISAYSLVGSRETSRPASVMERKPSERSERTNMAVVDKPADGERAPSVLKRL